MSYLYSISLKKPEFGDISPDALLFPQMSSFARNDHFLMKNIPLRYFYRGAFLLLLSLKTWGKYFFLSLGKNSYLYVHHHQVICISGHVKAPFIFYLKNSAAFTN